MNVIIKSSLEHVKRSRAKTALFTLLLATLAAFLSLCVMLLSESRARLAALDDAYTTLGVVEYYGDAFPDVWAYDALREDVINSFDHAAVTGGTGLVSYSPCQDTIASVAGFQRRTGTTPWRNSAIIIIKGLYYVPSHDTYMCLSVDTLYDFKGNVNQNLILDMGDYPFTPEYDAFYVLHGQYVQSRTSLPCFQISAFPEMVSSGDGVIPYLKLDSGKDAFLNAPPAAYAEAAELYTLMNSAVVVFGMDDAAAFLPMQQQKMELTSGRLFTDAETRSGANVCLVSDIVLGSCGLQLGDQLDLGYLDYHNESCSGVLSSGSAEIVGTVRTSQTDQGFICMPNKAIPESAVHLGYTLGTAVVKNDRAAAFFDSVNARLPARSGITLYDQGYAQAASGAKALLRTAIYLTVVCVVACLGVIALFGFLFVFRQKESIGIMQALGAGRKKTVVYLLFGALAVAVFATLLGVLLGVCLSGQIHALAARDMATQALAGSIYGTSTNGFTFLASANTHASFLPSLLACCCIPLASLGSCAIFAHMALRQYTVRTKPRRSGTAFPARPCRSSSLPAGPVKFALLSIARSGWRSWIVPLVSALLLLFLGTLTQSLTDSRAQLDTLAENTDISGYFTDTEGRRVGTLSLPQDLANQLQEFEGIARLDKSYSIKYQFLGVPRSADGTMREVSQMEMPDLSTIGGQFRFETLKEQMAKQPDVFLTTNIATVPEFFYAGAMDATFLEGYDASVFQLSYDEIYERFPAVPCIVPRSLMEQHGLQLGDTIRLTMSEAFYPMDFYVIGSFRRSGAKDNIYAPLDALVYWGSISYVSANFALKDASYLEAFTAFLEQNNYGAVDHIMRNRMTVVVQDGTYLAAKTRLTQQINYLTLLLPILYLLVCALGFVISYLMMNGRKLELAMMRALGARPLTVLSSYFTEYVLLCAAGCLPALLFWAFTGRLDSSALWSTALYLACYLIGCLISILRLCRSRLLRSLTSAE